MEGKERELINMAWGRYAIPPIPSPTNTNTQNSFLPNKKKKRYKSEITAVTF